MGYSRESGIPLEFALYRNIYYSKRTFIEATQQKRELGVQQKHVVLNSLVKGKDIILVDDSIVRGTSIKYIIKRLRESGAGKIYIAVVSPPIKYKDYYGIDIPATDKNPLIAKGRSVEEIRNIIDADDLYFLSIEGTYAALGEVI